MRRALILAPFDRECVRELRPRLDVTHESWLETRRLWDPEELGRRLKQDGVSVLVVEADFVFEELFEIADAVKFVGVCHGALNHVDVEAANRHGVVVVNTPGRNAQAVAEHVVGLMLALARRIPEAIRYVSEGRWQDPTEPYREMRGVELSGRVLGIVGLGAIGRRLAAIAGAIGMTVLAHDPHVSDSEAGLELAELDRLLRLSDFVSLHVPATADTEGLLDRRRIGLMKPTAYLLNTSTSTAVDQPALVAALQANAIAGAAIDVFESHPITPANPLLGLDNVILTPHVGGATEETVRRHSRMITGDVLRWLDGRRPERLANPEVWDRRG